MNLIGVTAIAAGGNRTVALKNDGTVWDWGFNRDGELGDGSGINTDSNTPVKVKDLTGITAISAGDLHSVALTSNGTVLAWGYNAYGQLGDGTSTFRNTPVQVSGLTGIITQIAAGGSHTVALTKDGAVWAWGLNSSGQLGDGTGTKTDSDTPVKVSGLTGIITQIAAGGSHTVALTKDG
ncbi:MAG: RCC1 repeat-containing protein, partial [Bacteroidia bacterium]|nr:RCC1 repeat-containing protein [Bacteroidia bacterium]